MKKVGSCRYAEHPSTELLCLGWAVGDEEPELWTPADPPPEELFRFIDGGALVHAWNAEFEMAIWEKVCVGKRDWPGVPFKQWRDPSAVALSFALPVALDKCGDALGVDAQKDSTGKHLVRKLCKPRRPSKHNPATRWTPESNPGDFAGLYHYCRQDVRAERAIQKALPQAQLPKGELEVWRMTARMNRRGWHVDMDSVRRILVLLAEHEERCLEELAELTGGEVRSTRQTEKSRAWLRARGVDLPDLQADTVEATLMNRDLLPPEARRFLEIRRELSKSSTKKYEAMRDRVCEDGSVKDLILYHGATTGRDAGRGIQIQNFPRAKISKRQESVERAFEALRAEEPLATVELLYGSAPHFASKLLRPSLVARPGYDLLSADFASIENRITVWLADCRYGIKIFEDGLDQYKMFARDFYRVAYDEVTDEQRGHAKQAILGCLAVGTLVLTDRGWLPIESVNMIDRVWDGAEWVCHGGVAFRGRKEVTCLEGLWATLDHEILTPDGWSTIARLARSGGTQFLKSAIGLAASQLPKSAGDLVEAWRRSSFTAIADGMGPSTFMRSLAGARRAAERVAESELPSLSGDADSVRSCLITRTARGGSGWQRGARTLPILETRSALTYDVLNAGPHRRFVVLTRAGPLLVHNCCFGMGVDTFIRQAAQFGQIVEKKDAEDVVQGYRRLYPEVASMWYELAKAGQYTVETGLPSRCGKVRFSIRDRFLLMRLPSGRSLAYPDPRVEQARTPWGEMRPTVTHGAVLKPSHRWGRTRLIPGRYMENAVQATARDAMMEGAKETIWAGYELVGRVHDELVSERREGEGSLEEYERLMATPLEWLRGIPIVAKGWRGKRYRKD